MGGTEARPTRVAVVGGGITGLSAAYFLTRQAAACGWPLECVLFEAASELGGKVKTLRADLADPAGDRSAVDGGGVGGGTGEGTLVIEQGPDSLYAFKPEAIELARELGLQDSLVGARTGLATYVWRRGRLRRLPDGLLGLAPVRLGPFVRSDLLSLAGRARMALEPFVPARRDGADESVGAFVARRLGREAVDALADPLLAGIHAADPWKLSLLATYPQLREQEARHGSLLRAARARQAAASSGSAGPGHDGARGEAARPVFWSLRGGLGELTSALARRLHGRCALRLRCPVESLWPTAPAPGVGPGRGRFALRAQHGHEEFDAVILAVPAWEAARLVRPWAPELAGQLAEVQYASVAVAAMVFAPGQIPQASVVRRSTGVLVPAAEASALACGVSACTWLSTKWPHVSPDGWVIVRAFLGRDASPDPLSAGDAELLAEVRRALRSLAGIVAEPEHAWVFRWPQAMPQYRVGHLERLARVDALRSRWPGLFVVGAGLRGMGLSDCVRQAEQAARACLRDLGVTVEEGGFKGERGKTLGEGENGLP